MYDTYRACSRSRLPRASLGISVRLLASSLRNNNPYNPAKQSFGINVILLASKNLDKKYSLLIFKCKWLLISKSSLKTLNQIPFEFYHPLNKDNPEEKPMILQKKDRPLKPL